MKSGRLSGHAHDWEMRQLGDFALEPERARPPRGLPGQRQRLADRSLDVQRRRRQHDPVRRALPALSPVGLPGAARSTASPTTGRSTTRARAVLRRQRSHDGRLGSGRRSRVSAEGRCRCRRCRSASWARRWRSGFDKLGWHWWPSDSAITTPGTTTAARLHQRRARVCSAARRAPRPAPTSPTGRSALRQGVTLQDALPRARDHRRANGMADGVIYYDGRRGAPAARRRSWSSPATASARRGCC